MDTEADPIWQLLQHLRACARHVQRGVDNHPLDEIDVGLLALAAAPGAAVRPTDAADRLEAAAPTITRHVRKLAEAGLLRIEHDRADGRSYRMTSTDAGRAFFDRFRTGLIDMFTPVLTGWSADDIATLNRLLGKLDTAMTTVRADRAPDTGKTWWKTAGLTSPE